MLKYLILSTPRCGSSTLMACCEIVFGAGSFVREPLNPYEDSRHHPSILHDASIRDRAAILCDPASPVIGIKHVYSPFNPAMTDPSALEALRRVLAIDGLRVILLSRQNLRHQFVSMEIALQTGDWWSYGPDALPDSIDSVRAGRQRPIDDGVIRDQLFQLNDATSQLRTMCCQLKVDLAERSYEELFVAQPLVCLQNIASALTHFGVTKLEPAVAAQMGELLGRGRRFRQIANFHKQLGEIYPSLHDP